MKLIFENLTARCVHLSGVRYDLWVPLAELPSIMLIQSTRRSDDVTPWVMKDRMQSWGGTVAQRSWRYLQECLERNDGPETDYEYHKAVLGKILDEDRTCRLPAWLVQFFEVCLTILISVLS